MSPIRIERLTKTFGRGKRRVTAVDDLSLDIAPGQVYGFLGPNGAGKTTTIRILLNLIHSSTGSVRIFNENPYENPLILRRVGSLVESPTFYPYLSGKRNMQVLADTAGIPREVAEPRVEALIEQVGLGARARQRVSGYSLGMRQRLSVVAALLNDPPLVIFDEPTNGLDPAGIQEMRVFIRRLVEEQGKTVFLSSHLLSEVEQLCDRVAIIHRGKLMQEGAVSTLLNEHTRVRIEAEPLDGAAAVLEGWELTRETDALLVKAGRADIPALTRRLVEREIAVFHITLERTSLEELFLQITGGQTV